MRDLERVFADADFDEMIFRVHRVPKGEHVYPKFKGFEDFPAIRDYKDKRVDKNMAIKYVVFAYDRQSPIHKKFSTDILKRKTTAALYAGFIADETTGLFEDEVTDMMMGMNRYINWMIIDYVRQYNDPEYSLLVAGHESLYQKLSFLMSNEKRQVSLGDENNSDEADLSDFLKNEKLKGELYNQAKNIADDLAKIAAKILTDENKFLRRDLYTVIDPRFKNRLNITPERMAGII